MISKFEIGDIQIGDIYNLICFNLVVSRINQFLFLLFDKIRSNLFSRWCCLIFFMYTLTWRRFSILMSIFFNQRRPREKNYPTNQAARCQKNQGVKDYRILATWQLEWRFVSPIKNGDVPASHLSFLGGTWRIIPVTKWLITMVTKSPK